MTEGYLTDERNRGNYGPRLHQALVLLQHLRPERTPEAIFAHRVLVAEIAGSLKRRGVEDCNLLALVEHLHAYIEHAGYDWRGGKWVVSDSHADACRALAALGISPETSTKG